MSRLSNWLLITILLISPCLGQTLADYALKRGVGVRAAGMGSAYTAVADDASAVFYNPAGLAEPGFAYSYGDPDSEQRTTNSSFELLKLAYIGYGNWQTQLGTDEAKVTAFSFSNRSGWLSWGLTYKGVTWQEAGVNSEGWTSDIGFLVRVTPNLRLGFLAQDLFTSKTSLAPASGRLGFCYKPLKGVLTLSGDLELERSAQTKAHFGLETNVAQGLTMRGGLDQGNPTLGLSLDLAIFSFDYAASFDQSQQATQRWEMGLKVLPSRERPFSIIKPKEYALIDISGALKGGRSEVSFLGGLHLGVDSILSQIRQAAKDPAIDGIMLKIGGFGGGLGGMAIVQEIRSELERARANGKKIVAYIEGSAVGDEYYLAAVADRIVAPPGSAIGGFGKSLEIMRLKGLFKKIGLEYQVFTQGDYKDAMDPYARDKMTPKQEAMVRGLIADLYRVLITDVAKDRNIKLDKMKEIGDGMVFPARLAQQMGLVDDIGYYKDAKKIAAELLGEPKDEAKIVSAKEIKPESAFLTKVFGVAVVEIDGEIVSGTGGENLIFGGRYVGSENIVRYIRKASDDVFVKAIILRINTPGGDAIAAGEIYQAVQYAREKDKVVVASIGSLGTSGGYYIAAAADKIVVDRSSLTGSIGVIGYLPMIKDLLDKVDVKADVIKEGEHADMFSGLRRLTTVEVFAIKRLQKESYEEFIQAVVDGRSLSTAEVEAAAQGQLYTGDQALDQQLVDQIGAFSDAVDLAKKEAKIIGEPRLIFYHQPSVFFTFGEGLVESLGLKDGLLSNYGLSSLRN